MNKHLIRFAIGATLIGVIFFLNTIGCNNDKPGPTAPTIFDVPTEVEVPRETPPPGITTTPEPEPEEPKAARGRIIEGAGYLQCQQSTNYPKDYLSIFRVADSGAQSHYATYGDDPNEHPEGKGPCGVKIQADCTVRDADPTPGAISAYNLYAAFIGVLDCPAPVCVSCGKDDESSDDSSDESSDDSSDDNGCHEDQTDFRAFFEGECEDRISVTITEFTNSCTGEVRQERTETPSPDPSEECGDDSSSDDSSEDECSLPANGSAQFERPLGNPTNECAHFGLVPDTNGDFFLAKCGLFYEWSSYITSPGTCSNGQDISHITRCSCPNGV